MSPIPYVRGQVVVLAILVAGAGLFDAAILGACCGLAALAWLLLLRQKYRRDLIRTAAAVPPHRARLDRVVAGDTLVTLLPATLLAVLFATEVGHPLAGHEAVHGATAALVVAATVVWASSLFDWYLILPRVSGQLGPRPCRSTSEVATFPFPTTWKEVTRWWYIHRVVAAFAFRVGLSTALAVAIGKISGLDQEARWFAGVAMLLFSSYAFSALWHGVGQAGHAKAIVGQTVCVERRPGKRRKLPPFTRLRPLRLDGRYYVVDVAIESVQIVNVEAHEAEGLPEPEKFERHPDSVLLPNVDALHPEKQKFCGCDERCSGINWYCIENPRCFEVKYWPLWLSAPAAMRLARGSQRRRARVA
jgi:hypothetical protein